ncbi:hypothetical protein J3R83DRAFT_11628 [Lanmaoa asiatica]|nr:hypothetical protein J3R83DRAFT_5894 [Lanmaoa asiatica]KAH0834272.1 hypothetical protein J3R83DRAFT_11628 [Lanmaoa asiatica]
MTVVQAVAGRYRPRRLINIKSLSPLIALIVRDGALYYFVYVLCTWVSILIVLTV